jgi:hypothetical protein
LAAVGCSGAAAISGEVRTRGGKKMQLSYRVVLVACIGVFMLASAAAAQNMLANPGFETGDFTDWLTFGNAYVEDEIPEEPGRFLPYEGLYVCSMYGNFSGGFNVSGIFQEFPTCPGDEWSFAVKSRHSGYDPMTADGVDDNWVVQKIAWFDEFGEIGGVESRILDGTFPIDTWFDNDLIVGVAPEGAVKMQALVLYLQPLWDGGSAQIDACELYFVPGGASATEQATWGHIKALYR